VLLLRDYVSNLISYEYIVKGVRMRLSGKVAIITGASRGIGKDIALGFAKEGADVVVASRSDVEGELPGTIFETAEEVRALGVRALPVKCDISNAESVNEMIASTLKQFGHIDVLVNNATSIVWWQPVLEMPFEDYKSVIITNLIGTFLCIKAVLPKMMEQKSGSIINISSKAAHQKGKLIAGLPYGVSKAGIEQLTRGLADELGQYNIAINSVKPGKSIGTPKQEAHAGPDADRSNWQSSELIVKACVFFAQQGGTDATGVVATDEEVSQQYGLV
jgi:NAD(P)-dependent dehydrogenase (short-subunit alcohol dehydrogenase family)